MSEREGYSSTTGTSYICCPFFVAHDRKAVYCEGCIAGTKSSQIFNGEEEKRFHQRTYCENRYDRCEHYLSVMHWKWPEDE